jgi:hypothetical protein
MSATDLAHKMMAAVLLHETYPQVAPIIANCVRQLEDWDAAQAHAASREAATVSESTVVSE